MRGSEEAAPDDLVETRRERVLRRPLQPRAYVLAPALLHHACLLLIDRTGFQGVRLSSIAHQQYSKFAIRAGSTDPCHIGPFGSKRIFGAVNSKNLPVATATLFGHQ